MKSLCALMAVLSLMGAAVLAAAQPASAQSTPTPTLIRLDGQLKTPTGEARTGSVTMVVSLYAGKDDTTPLWVEQQVVTLDANGRYTVFAGASLPDGVPQEFLAGATRGRWLGLGAQGEAEQFRMMLVTVPYAAKAREAETLAGKSLSDFVLTESLSDTVRSSLKSQLNGTNGASANGGGPGTSGITNYLEKCANTASPCTLADSLLFDNATNVGIATTSPVAKLDIRVSGIAPPSFAVTNVSAGGGTFGINAIGGAIGGLVTGDALMQNGVGNIVFSPNAAGKAVRFIGGIWTNPVSMTVADGGNVGIGTSAPAAKLEISAAGVAPSSFSIVNPDAGGGRFGINAIGGSIASVVAGDALIQNGVGNLVFSPNAAGKGIRFIGGVWTNPISMVVKANGTVGIGTTDTFARLDVEEDDQNGTAVLGVANNGHDAWGVYGSSTHGVGVVGQSSFGWAGYFTGNVQVNSGDLQVSGGDVHVTGNVCAANVTCPTPSDARLKQNVRSLDYGLPQLMRLRPVSWTWIDQTQKQLPIGLIAQEVEAVVPELVTTGHDAGQTKRIDYIGLVPVAIKAIQEQQETITTINAENTVLKQQNATLDARVTALEQALQQLLGQPQGQAQPSRVSRSDR